MKRRIIIIVGSILIIIIATLFGLKKYGIWTYAIPSPVMENTIPVGSRLLVWQHKHTPERFETIIYHSPLHDTVVVPEMPINYYQLIKSSNRKYIKSKYEIKYMPLKKRTKWLGRCIGLPGDIVLVKNGDLYVNGSLYKHENLKKCFVIESSDRSVIHKKVMEKFKIKPSDIIYSYNLIQVFASEEQAKGLELVSKGYNSYFQVYDSSYFDENIFPYSENFKWNKDQFGELKIPEANQEINLSMQNIALYKRMIEAYEGHKLEIRDSIIFIDGTETKAFVPKQNYYFIINDNRDNSLDSRYFGFLPKDHICGKILTPIE